METEGAHPLIEQLGVPTDDLPWHGLDAERLLRSFLQRHERHVEAMRLLARIGYRLDVLDDAEFLLESAALFAPDNHVVRYDYAVSRALDPAPAQASHAWIVCVRALWGKARRTCCARFSACIRRRTKPMGGGYCLFCTGPCRPVHGACA